MPTERFLRLPDEKKTAILRAAVDEFSRVPFDKVSINQIIKNAEISRGSFYTYFEDKMDVLRYIFQDTKRQYQDFCRETLVDSGGDFWKMVEELFHQVLYRDYSGRLARLFQNGDGKKMDEWMYEQVDKSQLRVESLEEFRVLIEMCMLAILMAFAQRYKDKESIESVEWSFFRKMDFLKNGVLKHKES